MKKSLPNFFFALGAALLLSACGKESISRPQWAETSFSLTLEAVKSAGDGADADHLAVLPFDKDGNPLDDISFTCTQSGPGRFTAQARLVKGVEYTLLFFAQKGETYSLDRDGTLSLPGFGALNDASRDAFSAVQTVVGGASSSLSLSLRRPFALLSLVSSQADQAAAQEQGRSAEVRVGLVLEGVPDRMNLLTGAVEGSVQASFPAASAPSSQDLAFCFLPAGESKALVKAAVTVTAGDFTSVRNLENLPLRRNCRTCITGDFLTTEGSLDINLENN